jgi:hypothetical protein
MILSSLRDLIPNFNRRETQGLRPKLLSGAPLSRASDTLIADNPLAEFPDTSGKPPVPPEIQLAQSKKPTDSYPRAFEFQSPLSRPAGLVTWRS